MGRPKVDHSQTICDKCGKSGNYCAKGLCRICYGSSYFKQRNVGEVRERRLENAKRWNRENRDRFNEAKRASYARSIGKDVPYAPSRQLPIHSCNDCNDPDLPIFSKGRCLSCYGKYRHREFGHLHRPKKMAKKYGITIEEYHRLFDNAGGVCEICKGARRLVIDHDHNTGKVRGILCDNCNLSLGRLDAVGIEVSMAIIDYMKQHSNIESPPSVPTS